MKNAIKLLSILLLASGVVFTSCGDDDNDSSNNSNNPDNSSGSTPTNLSVTDITNVSAKLTWLGKADSYEIMVKNKTYTATTTACVPTDLTASTRYTWKVRSKQGTHYSDWVEGPDFSTNGVLVQFGTETWTAATTEITTDGKNFKIKAFKTAPPAFPYVTLNFKASETTTSLSEGYTVEYWERDTFLLEGDPTVFSDWWSLYGSINVTSINGSKVSGNAEIRMDNAYQYYVLGMRPSDKRDLTVSFTNVNVVSK